MVLLKLGFHPWKEKLPVQRRRRHDSALVVFVWNARALAPKRQMVALCCWRRTPTRMMKRSFRPGGRGTCGPRGHLIWPHQNFRYQVRVQNRVKMKLN